MRRRVEWRRRALADLAALEPQIRRRVEEAIERMAADGRRDSLRKLHDRNDEWRLRVGDWRVILTFDHPNNAIIIWQVLHRREAYRRR